MTSNFPARRDLRRASILVSFALVVTACGGTTASPSATPAATAAPTASPASTAPNPTASEDASAIYAAVNEQVRAIRGLDEKTPVEPRIVSPEEMATVVRESFEEDAPPDLIAGYDRLYKGLGLMSAQDDLSDLYVDLL
jgi:hypothetical protein